MKFLDFKNNFFNVTPHYNKIVNQLQTEKISVKYKIIN